MTFGKVASDSPQNGAFAVLHVNDESSATSPSSLLHGTIAGSLVYDLTRGKSVAALTFAGQGMSCLQELTDIQAIHPEVRPWITAASDAIAGLLELDDFAWSGLYSHGFALEQWVENPETRPSETYLTSSTISQPLIFITQIARYQALFGQGLEAIFEANSVACVTGHSQGMMPALLVAESVDGRIDLQRFVKYVEYFTWQGLHMAQSFGDRGVSQTAGTPMAAVSGLTAERLEAAIDAINAAMPNDPVSIALYNTRTRHVVSGPARTLEALQARLERKASSQQTLKRQGRFAGRPDTFTWEFIPVGAAFHSNYMRQGLEGMLRQVKAMGFQIRASDLRLEVLSPADGQRLNDVDDLMTNIVTAQFVRSVRWTDTIRALWHDTRKIDVVLDLGPGDAAARLIHSNLRGTGMRVLALSTSAGRSSLLTAGHVEARPTRYSDLMPRLVQLPDQRIVASNRYTKLTGQSPIILPGMTPTTSDVPIVAAAANGGFTAELAGGGQVTEAIFTERLKELSEALEPGREIVFNALYLDPYLWGLHLREKKLVQKARRAGAPICGVTISAGIPEVEEAVQLLDELVSLGLWLNAFKPGTKSQIDQIIAIARAAPHHNIFVHLEGGRAGGHHSWEDLEQLLLDSYHALRAEPNLILCVGGGISSPERAADLLTGRWSSDQGLPEMPVDAVFLGTLTMACAEALTSPRVKQALVDTAGTDRWVFADTSEGGVTSGRSQLGADIHYIDNAAARCGRLLDSVAGDAEAVQENFDAIVEALNATAKPWFGDLNTMTYLDTLQRMVELMAVGRKTRYEDGIWPDQSYRARVAAFVHRAEARLVEQDEGSFASLLQDVQELDDPQSVLERFENAYPDAATRTLHPADQDFFVGVCRRPGKPVNFVPVIDANVRRWYKSDSLWQAHDDRFAADQVLVIPGPEALRGIERADEPVAELLGRFEQALVTRLLERGISPVLARRRNLADDPALPEGLGYEKTGDGVTLTVTHGEPAWFGYVACAFQGQLGEFFGVQRVYDADARALPAPIRRLCVPNTAARLAITLDAQTQEVAQIVWSQGNEEVRVLRQGDRIVLETKLPASTASVKPSIYIQHFTQHATSGGFVVHHPSGALRDFYHQALFGEALTPAPLFEEARETVKVDARRAQAYAALTSGLVHGQTGIPLGMTFSLIWRPLMRTLSCDLLAPGLLDLVHLSNHTELGEGWPTVADEELEVRARVVRVEDSASGRAVTTEAHILRRKSLCAKITSVFFIRGEFSATQHQTQASETVNAQLVLADEANVRFLQTRPWVQLNPDAELAAGDTITLKGILFESRPRKGAPHFKTTGLLVRGATPLGTVQLESREALKAHPVRAALMMLGSKDDASIVTRRTLATAQDTTPGDMSPYARVSRDLNPIHRSPLMARLAGLPKPIVHGMWTAARLHSFAVTHVAGGAAKRIAEYRVEFVEPAFCDEALVMQAHRVAARNGALQVELTAAVVRGEQQRTVAKATLWVKAPRTAYVFPGQGIQQPGMGMESYERSPAARAVWERADRYTREKLGFSILRVVRENPSELIVDGVAQVHPRGVLHLTQFTQVAMAVVAMAQVAQLREAGVLVEDAVTCGHSVGEYNALAAIAEVLPLEDVVEIVYHRGRVMHRLVARDADGESGYRMGVIRPNCAGLDHAGAEALVEAIGQRSGHFLQIVNYNIRNWQYSVTGETEALQILKHELEARRPEGAKAPYLEVPGIDVPFHSRVLANGVESFRATLQERLPSPIDVDKLLGRYIPNLVPRPFSIDRAFIEEVFAATDSTVLADVLGAWETWSQDPQLARVLLIELLAWQFASPVRWIETQELLMHPLEGLGIERIIEIGVGYQPTLVNMARASRRILGAQAQNVVLLNVEADSDAVFYSDSDPKIAIEDVDEPVVEAKAVAQAPIPTRQAASSAPQTIQDRPFEVKDALMLVLAAQAKVRPEQIRADETIDDLFEGVSSRRNQVLMDLGAEFNAGAIDGAHEKPLSALAELLDARSGGYNTPGAYLRGVQDEALTRVLGRSRMRRRDVTEYLLNTWGLGEGLSERAICTLALETRSGDSGRGGPLGSLASAAPTSPEQGREVLDQVAAHLAAQLSLQLTRQGATGSADTAVDAAAVHELAASITGPRGVLAEQARDLLDRLGEGPQNWGHDTDPSVALQERLNLFEREHGAAYERLIQPRFDARRHVAFTSAWAFAQRDVARLYFDATAGRIDQDTIRTTADRLALFSGEKRVRETARWYEARAVESDATELAAAMHRIATSTDAAPTPIHASRPVLEITPEGALRYREEPASGDAFIGSLTQEIAHVEGWGEGYLNVLQGASKAALDFQGRTALVTGASPGSIALETVRHLLRGGARVVVTTTNATPERLAFYRKLYQNNAARSAELHVVPFNQGSFTDIDALVEWLFTATTEQAGASVKVLKRPFAPDLVLPFGALGDVATIDAPSDRGQAVIRVMLLGVERLVGAIARRYRREGLPEHLCHVVLPMSPNHGSFGGDGVYAETKAALEVMLHKWRSEHHAWGHAITLAAARIGWVRGTGLMDTNNPVAARLETETKARTFSSGEMGLLIAGLCVREATTQARQAPLRADLTGGFGRMGNVRDVVEGMREALAHDVAQTAALTALEAREATLLGIQQESTLLLDALPEWLTLQTPVRAAQWPEHNADLTQAIVIVGAGEIGPLGSSRTRFDIEVENDLSAASVIELAWLTGLIRYDNGRWLDNETRQEVDEAQIASRYRDQVRERSGIRLIDPDVAGYDPEAIPVMAKVYLDRDFTFAVASEHEARQFTDADPDNTRAHYDAVEGCWKVTRRAGSQMSVPRRLRLNRRVAGLVPTGFDFARYGVTPDMIENVDRVTLFNLIATVDAFVSAGLSPEELMQHVHPARVANTQGSGIGGMRSIKRLYVDYVLGEERQNDILQETLINVLASYVVQSYVGSYGSMAHPVAACATAAVSLEEGMDKILAGRADFVVAGGFDDIGREGALGFADMNATADTDQMLAMGLAPHQMSRSNDIRRRGFVEAHGGGTLLLARGDVAVRMGLPVLGVLAWAGSFADGIHKSIPAPGMGALAAALGGTKSPLGKALSTWGLDTDDVALVYKHDTSTQANDPNENALHHRIQEALGRSAGNPLWAVSQKTITGHPKGGAAAWQVIGLCQSLSTGLIPGNRNLDCVDEAMRPWAHVAFTDETLRPGQHTLRAGLVTSLGFGHVGAIAMVIHPDAFYQGLDADTWSSYTEKLEARQSYPRDFWSRVLLGQKAAFVKRTERRFTSPDGSDAQAEEEAALLLDPNARFDPETGRFVHPK